LKLSSPRKISLLLSFIAFFLAVLPAYGAFVTLGWDPSTNPSLDHYVVYWGTSSRNYSMSEIIPSDTTTCRVNGLAANTRYYFTVAAVDEANNESTVSREVSWIKHLYGDEDGRDAEWGITTGTLKNFNLGFDSAADIPTLGDSEDIPGVNLPAVTSVGIPLNLQPSGTHFNPPVKIFIPCPGYRDVSNLNVYYYDDDTSEWYLANYADDPYTVQPDAVGWMVPGSRVNHNNGEPSTIEIQVYHFSGVQAATGNVNWPPVFNNIASKSVNEGDLLTFTVTASDPDGDGLTFSASNVPTGASFNPTTRVFSWTPDFGDAGNYSVTFTATDDGTPAKSDSETVIITVSSGSSSSSSRSSSGGGGGGCFISSVSSQ